MKLRHDPAARSRSGFTLLELIVASLMFAIVMASMSTVFFSAHRLRRTNEAELQGAHEIRRALNFLKRDLRSVTTPGTNATIQVSGVSTNDSSQTTNSVRFRGAMTTGSGAAGTAQGTVYFQFHSASGLRLADRPWSDIQRVTYTVRSPLDARNQAGNELIRTVTRNLLPGVQEDASERVLLRGVENVYFEFWTGQEWLDYWDSTTLSPETPQAVRTTVTMLPKDNASIGRFVQLVTPVFVQSLTNQVRSVTGGTG